MKAWLEELSVMPESLRVAMTVLRRHGGRGVREERREEGMGEGEVGGRREGQKVGKPGKGVSGGGVKERRRRQGEGEEKRKGEGECGRRGRGRRRKRWKEVHGGGGETSRPNLHSACVSPPCRNKCHMRWMSSGPWEPLLLQGQEKSNRKQPGLSQENASKGCRRQHVQRLSDKPLHSPQHDASVTRFNKNLFTPIARPNRHFI